MKSKFLSLVFLSALTFFFTGSAVAQDKGIQFEHGSWKDVLAKSKESGKPIFVDCYTAWCGPCKMMTRQTFTDSTVGAYFNSHFINYKLDMEQGEGPEFARKYAVRAYPTLFFIDGDGRILHTFMGFRPAEPFLAEGMKVAGGGAVAGVGIVGEMQMTEEQKRSKALSERLLRAAKEQDQAAYQDARREVLESEMENKDQSLDYAELLWYQFAGNWKKYSKIADAFVENHASQDANMLNNISWSFYENVKSKKMLKKALVWAQTSVQLDKKYFNLDTYAMLLWKTGNKDRAIQIAEEAILIAKKTGENYAETEKALGLMRK